MRRVLDSIGILTAERVLQLVSSAAVSVLLARLLGVDRFGLYAFVLSSVALVAPLLDVGQTILVRDLVVSPERRTELLAAAFRVGIAIAAALQVAAICFAVVVPEQLAGARLALIIGSLSLLARPLLVLDYWFQSRLEARPAAAARLTGLFVASALRVGVVVFGAHVLPLLAGTTIVEPLVAGLMMMAGFRRSGGEPRAILSHRPEAWAYFKRIGPLLVAGLSVALYMRLDQVMLGLLTDSNQVGQYAAAVRLSEFTYFIPLVINTSIAPGLAALHARDPHEFTVAYDRIMGAFVAVALALMLSLMGLSTVLVSALFGSGFEDAGHVLRIHVLSLPFVFLGVAQSVWNAVYDQQKLAMWRTVGGALINIVLNVVLIPNHGALGAAYATVIAYGFAAVAGNALSRATWPILVMQVRQFWPPRLARNLISLCQDVLHRVRTTPLP